jgi:hypothetical protein
VLPHSTTQHNNTTQRKPKESKAIGFTEKKQETRKRQTPAKTHSAEEIAREEGFHRESERRRWASSAAAAKIES